MALYRRYKVGDKLKIWCLKARPDPGPILISFIKNPDGSSGVRIECSDDVRIQQEECSNTESANITASPDSNTLDLGS